MPATSLYAALFGLVLVVLSVRTLRLRHKLKVGIGPGNDPSLERAMRVHANFCEYVPIALILIYLVELALGMGLWVHALGGTLLVGRLLHAYGVSQVREDYRFRVTGMAMTFTVIIGASSALLIAYVGRNFIG